MEAQLLITVKTLTENYSLELFVLGFKKTKKKKKIQQTIPPSAESPLHFLTISPSFISEPLMIQWVMRTQWWRRKYLSTFQTHSNFVSLKCTYRPEAGQNLLCFLLQFFWIIQAAPEACEPHTSEPSHHHNMGIVVHMEEVPLLLSAKWQVSNINITLGSSKPITHLCWNHQVLLSLGKKQDVRPNI